MLDEITTLEIKMVDLAIDAQKAMNARNLNRFFELAAESTNTRATICDKINELNNLIDLIEDVQGFLQKMNDQGNLSQSESQLLNDLPQPPDRLKPPEIPADVRTV